MSTGQLHDQQGFSSSLHPRPEISTIMSRGSSMGISLTPGMSVENKNFQMSRYIDDYTQPNPRENFISLRLPQRVFIWLYSISLFFFTVLTIGFVAVTPIDVIKQTLGTSSSGIKLFIVIIICIVFLVASLFLYFLRLYQNRISLNDIPSKSVYIPFYGDLSKDVCAYIDKKLVECLTDIKVKAGPLHNHDVVINHPGMAPPEYIQKRNKSPSGDGTLLPPNSCYEDVIRSLGDRFSVDGRILTQIDIPKSYSFREMIISLTKLVKAGENPPNFPDVKKMIELYEEFKFSGELINERDLLVFMVEFDKLAFFFQGSFDTKDKSMDQSKPRKSFNSTKYSTENGYDDLLLTNSNNKWYSSISELAQYPSQMFYSTSDLDDYPVKPGKNHDNKATSFSPYMQLASSDSNTSVINQTKLKNEKYSNLSSDENESPGPEEPIKFWSGTSLDRFKQRNYSASSSTGSVVKRKLALSSPQSDSCSVRRPSSGYLTDYEDEESQNGGEVGQEVSSSIPGLHYLHTGVDATHDDKLDKRDYKRGRKSSEEGVRYSNDFEDYNINRYPYERRSGVGQRPNSSMKLTDVDIKRLRLKSPEKLISEKFRRSDR